jgi:hypothetical protein
MAPRAIEGKLVGYAEDVYGGYIIKTKTGSLIVRRDVRFDDHAKDTNIFSEAELQNLYDEDKWNEYMFSVRNDEVFDRIIRMSRDEDNIQNNAHHLNPKDLSDKVRRKQVKRLTRSMAASINNYMLKQGEDPSKTQNSNQLL